MKTRLLPLLLAALAALCAVTPGAAWAGHGYGPPPGRVVVFNQSGGTVDVTVSGQPARTLVPWQTAELVAPAGDATVRATYYQFGAPRVLQSTRLFVTPGRSSSVVLAPESTARILVTNASPFQAQLFLDGRPDATFAPGESRVVATRLGRMDFAMMAGGRTLERASFTMRSFEELRWLVDPPRVGDLVVTNPLPIPIQLVCDKGLVRNVPAYGTTTYSALPVGDFRLTARRVTGEFVDGETATIRAGTAVGWRVDAPRTGFVSLDSDHFLGTEVRIDGKRMAMLAPNGVARVEVKVGWHEVTIVDERGRAVLATWIEVEPFDAARVAFGYPAHTPAGDRYDRHDRDDRRSERDRDEHDHDHGAVAESGESCGMR